jgi:hypothetical protein
MQLLCLEPVVASEPPASPRPGSVSRIATMAGSKREADPKPPAAWS